MSIRLGPELVAQIDAWAAKHGVSRSEAIRQLVVKALGKPGSK